MENWRFALWGNKAKETVNVGYKLCSHGAQLSKRKSAFKMNKASPGPHPDQPGHRLPRLMPDAEDQRTPLRLWFIKVCSTNGERLEGLQNRAYFRNTLTFVFFILKFALPGQKQWRKICSFPSKDQNNGTQL